MIDYETSILICLEAEICEMRDLLNKFRKDPVWSKIISALTIACFVTVVSYLSLSVRAGVFFDHLQSKPEYSWAYIFLYTSTPNWLLGILGVNMALTILIVALSLVIAKSSRAPRHLTWQDYNKDRFFGVTWRWNYNSGSLPELSIFCSHCDYRIFPQPDGKYNEKIRFDCGNCQSNLYSSENSVEYLKRDIYLKTDHNNRSGKWKEIVERHSETAKTIFEPR